MANQSIYSDRWIDLVFENRNKAYGAYQLRQENSKTTLKALLIGVLFLLTLVSIPLLMSKIDTKPVGIISSFPITPLVISPVVYPPAKPTKTQELLPLMQKETKKPEVIRENLIDPKITEAHNAVAEITPNTELSENFNEPIEGAVSGMENTGVKAGTGTSTESSTSETEGSTDATHVSAVLDKQPAFPGGINKFYSYVAQNFRTPETVLSKSIKVYVYFVIEKDGSMTDIQVLKNPGFGLDQEAIRVLKNLKIKWSPGILNGKSVRTSYNLPILVQQNQ